MRRFLKRAIVTVLVTILLLGGLVESNFAYQKKADGRVTWEDPVVNWVQWGMPECTSIILPGSSGFNMKTAACGWFSAYFALYKAGIVNPSNYNVKNLISDAKREKAYFGGWLLDYGKLNKIFPNASIEPIKDEDMGGNSKYRGNWGVQLGGLSQEKALKVASAFMKRGYYVVICLRSAETSGHYVFLDYVNPENELDFRIGDSAYGYTWLHEYKSYKSKGMRFGEMWVLDLSGGKTENLSFNRKSIYEDGAGASQGNTTNNKEPIKSGEVSRLLSELEIEGMGEYQKNLSQFQEPLYPGLELTDPTELLNAQKINEQRKNTELYKFFDRAVSAIGLVLIFYVGLLVFVYFGFGKVNPNIMKVFFFGRYVVTGDIQPTAMGITFNQFVIRLSVMLGVGILLASGVVFKIVLRVLLMLGLL